MELLESGPYTDMGSKTEDYALDYGPSKGDLVPTKQIPDPDLDVNEEDLCSVAHLENLTLGVTNGPVLAGNQISIIANGATNTRVAGVVFENHIHYVSNSSSVLDEDEGVFTECEETKRGMFSSLSSFYLSQYSWMSAWDGGPRYSTEDLYVGLRMHPMDRSGMLVQGDAQKKKILFDPFSRTGVTPRTVLVRGDPGFGKTTLCRKIVYDWAGQRKTFPCFQRDRTVVLYLDMMALPEDSDLENELLRLAVRKDLVGPEDENELDEVRQTLNSFGRNVILVLDGYVGVAARLREQVDQLVRSADPRSPFRGASVVVTSRSDVEDESLQLFQKNFVLKGFSLPLSQRLVSKYFKHIKDGRGSRFLDFLQRFQLKGLSPSAVLALCRCDTRKSSTDAILKEWIFRIVQFNWHRGNLQIDEFVERLGALFWKCYSKTCHEFSLKELQTELGSDYEHFLNCRLLKTTGIRTGRERVIWEPVHEFLMDGVAAHYIEKRWSSWVNADQVGQFLNSLLPRLSCVNVECSLDPEIAGKHFFVRFQYRQFQLFFDISEGPGKCYVQTSSTSNTTNTDREKRTLEMSYLISLRKKQDGEEVVRDLKTLFSDSTALQCLSRFLSPSRFQYVCLGFFAEGSWGMNLLLYRSPASTDYLFPSTYASLRRRSREFHVVFERAACMFSFVDSLLKRVLEVGDQPLTLRDALDVVETLRWTAVTPSFQAAHIYGQQYVRREPGISAVQDLSKKLCDRLELFFHADVKMDESF